MQENKVQEKSFIDEAIENSPDMMTGLAVFSIITATVVQIAYNFEYQFNSIRDGSPKLHLFICIAIPAILGLVRLFSVFLSVHNFRQGNGRAGAFGIALSFFATMFALDEAPHMAEAFANGNKTIENTLYIGFSMLIVLGFILEIVLTWTKTQDGSSILAKLASESKALADALKSKEENEAKLASLTTEFDKIKSDHQATTLLLTSLQKTEKENKAQIEELTQKYDKTLKDANLYKENFGNLEIRYNSQKQENTQLIEELGKAKSKNYSSVLNGHTLGKI